LKKLGFQTSFPLDSNRQATPTKKTTTHGWVVVGGLLKKATY